MLVRGCEMGGGGGEIYRLKGREKNLEASTGV